MVGVLFGNSVREVALVSLVQVRRDYQNKSIIRFLSLSIGLTSDTRPLGTTTLDSKLT